MLFAENDRCQYARPQLMETICQLRFPTILSIGSTDPAPFQEAIRHDFPKYNPQQEQQPPKVTGMGTPNAKLEQQPPVMNYNFISEDGAWKVNLTKDFVALSTLRYTRWEDFAARLDKMLAQFIQIYQPNFFERIGLRYVNAFSRQRLGLTDDLWDDLINAPFIGMLDQPDVKESAVSKNALDVEMSLAENHRMKLHAGPGLIGGGKQDPEPKFILDGDFSVSGKQVAPDQVPAELTELHEYAQRMFNAAITKELHEAMGPSELA